MDTELTIKKKQGLKLKQTKKERQQQLHTAKETYFTDLVQMDYQTKNHHHQEGILGGRGKSSGVGIRIQSFADVI